MATCYRLVSSPDTVRQKFDHHNVHECPPREAIWPKQPVLIVRNDHALRREAVLVRWGLIPAWVRDFEKLGTLASARAETLEEKASFRGAIRHKRCLVPADGFHVWTGRSGAKATWIVHDAEHDLMGFAALYEQWMGADGSEIDSMALISVPALGPVRQYCERMPVAIGADDFAAWLDCRNVRANGALELLQQQTSERLAVSATTAPG